MALSFWVSSRSTRSERVASQPASLADIFDEIEHNTLKNDSDDGVRLGALLNAVGRRSYGPLLLVIGLFAVSPITVIPGMTWLAAFLTGIVAGQMALGLPRPWLPKRALETKIPRKLLNVGLHRGRPWAERIDKVLKPRLEFLAAPPFVNLIALICIAAALVTIPLSLIPIAPILPSIAILLFGLGMTAKDGLLLLLGTSACAGAGWLVAPLIF